MALIVTNLQLASLPLPPFSPNLHTEDGYVKMFLRGRPIPMFVPDAVVATYNLDAKLDLPHKKLKLDWVYPSPWWGGWGNKHSGPGRKTGVGWATVYSP